MQEGAGGWSGALEVAPSPGDTEPCDQHQALRQNSGHFCCNPKDTAQWTVSSGLQRTEGKEGGGTGRRGSIIQPILPLSCSKRKCKRWPRTTTFLSHALAPRHQSRPLPSSLSLSQMCSELSTSRQLLGVLRQILFFFFFYLQAHTGLPSRTWCIFQGSVHSTHCAKSQARLN